MSLPVTALYAAILALILTALAINVTVHRWRTRVPLGQGGNALMARVVRVHGNAVEYVPISLVLMLIYEINGGRPLVLHITGIALIVARLLHAWGLGRSAGPSFGRAVGQSLTWLVIIWLALLNLMIVAYESLVI